MIRVGSLGRIRMDQSAERPNFLRAELSAPFPDLWEGVVAE